MKKSQVNNLINLIITFVSLLAILIIVMFSKKAGEIELKAGDACQEDIYAPSAVTDTITTNKLRQDARNKVPNHYIFDDSIGNNLTNNVRELFNKAEEIRPNLDTTLWKEDSADTDQTNDFINQTSLKLSYSSAAELLSAEKKEFSTMKKVIDIVEKTMHEPVYNADTERKYCYDEIDKLELTDGQRNALYEIISSSIVENMHVDVTTTEENKNAEASKVPDVVYKKGQIIIRKGEVATEAQIQVLKKLGMLKGTSPLSITYAVGTFLLIIISYAILTFFFWNSFKKQLDTLPILSITGLIVVLIAFYGNRNAFISENLISVLPFGMFPGIAAIFSSCPTAIISNLIISIFCGIIFDANWGLTICLALAGTMTAYSFASVKRRSHLLPAAVASSSIYALAFCAMSFIEVANTISAFAALGKGLLGGILSGLITIGSIQFFEWIFNATTPMKLSELTNPENKLLKKLLVEAPGSYHHALTVANISEIAARSIKADSLLARVGAYYHDIGKIRHPLYFKENQYGKNPHDSLTPEQSSALIISHVTDGYEIAQKNRLPKVVCDIIAQHHGTTTTGYFLIRAKELDPNADESKFTYPGPRPQTREAAIVMLADSCEAAVRSIDDKTEAKIEAMVRKIATERVNAGQFSQCNLTFAELELIIKVITKTLGGYFHERIKYE